MSAGAIRREQDGEALEKPKEEKVDFVETRRTSPTSRRKPPKPPQQVAAVAAAEGLPGADAPVEIPDVIPEIDLSRKVTDEADFAVRA